MGSWVPGLGGEARLTFGTGGLAGRAGRGSHLEREVSEPRGTDPTGSPPAAARTAGQGGTSSASGCFRFRDSDHRIPPQETCGLETQETLGPEKPLIGAGLQKTPTQLSMWEGI